MLRRSVLSALLITLAGACAPGYAQESGFRVSNGDTIRYTYTPLPQDTPRKKTFLKSIVDYFGE